MINRYKYIGTDTLPTRLVSKGCVYVVRIQDIFGQYLNITFDDLAEAKEFINLFVVEYLELNILGGLNND
jgi:hypothetical protein